MAQQTAVEWLAEKYNYITWMRNRDEMSQETADKLRQDYLEQAKQMEKDQLIKFSKYILEEFTVLDYYEYEDFEEYYNEIFKK